MTKSTELSGCQEGGISLPSLAFSVRDRDSWPKTTFYVLLSRTKAMGQGAPRALRVAVLVSAAVAWESDVRRTTTTHAVGSGAVPAAAEVLARRLWESDVRDTTTSHSVGSAAVPAAAEVLARRFKDNNNKHLTMNKPISTHKHIQLQHKQ